MNWETVYVYLLSAGHDLLALWACVLLAAGVAVFSAELRPDASTR